MRFRALLIDHQDSFTHILIDYLEQIDIHLDFVQSECIPEIVSDDFDLIIISPGFGQPQEKNSTIQFLNTYLGKIPILGICLGHQLLAFVDGGRLGLTPYPMHGLVTQVEWSPLVRKSNDFDIHVMHYHSWVVRELPIGALPLAHCLSTNLNMGMYHPQKLYLGWQFHPESVGTIDGIEVLRYSLHLLLSYTYYDS